MKIEEGCRRDLIVYVIRELNSSFWGCEGIWRGNWSSLWNICKYLLSGAQLTRGDALKIAQQPQGCTLLRGSLSARTLYYVLEQTVLIQNVFKKTIFLVSVGIDRGTFL